LCHLHFCSQDEHTVLSYQDCQPFHSFPPHLTKSCEDFNDKSTQVHGIYMTCMHGIYAQRFRLNITAQLLYGILERRQWRDTMMGCTLPGKLEVPATCTWSVNWRGILYYAYHCTGYWVLKPFFFTQIFNLMTL